MRPAAAHISRSALLNNIAVAKRLAPRSKCLAVIKADAYGHGALNVATTLSDHCDGFALATVEEALALRDEGITKPLLVMQGHNTVDELALAAKHALTLVAHSDEQVADILQSSQRISLWLKLDTGMHRLGLDQARLTAAWQALSRLDNVTCDVLMSHFANADQRDDPFNAQQMAHFSECRETLPTHQSSFSNSAALWNVPDAAGDWIRPGIMLYGASPLRDPSQHTGLIPAMRTTAAVIAIRDLKAGDGVGYQQAWRADGLRRIATVGFGYADGFPRTTQSGTKLMVGGHQAPLCGRVSMDSLAIDITGIDGVSVGSEVELWGPNVPPERIAAASGTSAYELLARMPARVPRIMAD